MEFRVLGSLEVLDADGHALAPAGRRARALLAILLLHANETVGVDRLVDELWGEEPPATATKVVHNLVSQLRKSLGGRLETVGQAYRLRVEAGELDLTRFQQLVREAARCREAGDPGAAAAMLGEALSLWRGPALADLGHDGVTVPAGGWLEELRLAALEEWADAELELGHDGGLVGELEQLVAEQPLRERLRGQLMRALYRAGRQADALAVYREGRTVLAEELGLDPGEELRRLEQAILRHDPALEPPHPEAPAAATAPVPAVRDRRPRARRLALAGAALLLAAAAAAALTLGRGGGASVAVPPNSVAAVDPRTGRVVAATRVGSRPVAIAVTPAAVWVANADDGTLSRVGPRTRRVVQTIGIGGPLADVAATGRSVWVVTGSEGGLVEIDSKTGTPVRRLDLSGRNELMPAGAYTVAVGHGAVWVGSDAGGGGLLRIDPKTGRVTAAVRRGWTPSGIVLSGDALWTTFLVGGTVRLEPGTATITASIDVPADAVSLAAGAGLVWVGQRSGRVWQIAPATATVVGTVPVEGSPIGIAVGGGHVWVAGDESGVLSEIDAGTGAVVRSIRLGGTLLDVAYGDGLVWVAVAQGDRRVTALAARPRRRAGPRRRPRRVHPPAGGAERRQAASRRRRLPRGT